MRVIAGTAKSLKLKTIEGSETRPTTDRIKETLFNMLTGELNDCDFLDLFAGSGGIGIEAISRGAKSCTFVEMSQKSVNCIKENLTFTKFTEKANVYKYDAISYLMSLAKVDFDIIFMDPPYDRGLEKRALTVLSEKELSESTLIVVEASLDEDFSYLENIGFYIAKEKIYKTNKHIFIRKGE